MSLSEIARSLAGNNHVTEAKKVAVWFKGHSIPGYDPIIWQKDDYGYPIKYTAYGDRNSEYGWELDHYPVPKSMGGSDDICNLRPLHYRPNASHGGLLSGYLKGIS